MDVEHVADSQALARQAAHFVAERAEAALRERDRFTLAVSGGTTPLTFFSTLAEMELEWERVHVFQVDERVAPEGHPDRNLVGLSARLAERVPLHLHPMPVTAADLDHAAAAYGAELASVCGGAAPALDVVHLGLGDDGHTASWPPGDPVIDVTDVDVAVVGPFNGRVRMTLTPPAVNRARSIFWLIDDSAKSDVLDRLVAADPSIPASRVRRDAVLLTTSPVE